MACQYKSRGENNPINTQVLQYIEDTPSANRTTQELDKILGGLQVIVESEQGAVLLDTPSNRQAIEDINEASKIFFAVSQNLINLVEYGPKTTFVTYNQNVLKSMSPITQEEYEKYEGDQLKSNVETDIPASVPETLIGDEQETKDETEPSENEEELLINEVFQRKQKKDQVTQQIIANLQLQIERLERLPEETLKSEKRLNELLGLQAQLKRVLKGSEKLDDYFNFVSYMFGVSTRGKLLMSKLEQEYARNYKTMPQSKRAEILKTISDLKETIDAFYNDSADLSVSTLLLQKIQGMTGNQETKDTLIVQLANAIKEMGAINNQYLDIAIPIQVDYMMSFAPIEINEQLDARIKAIRTSQRLSGINTSDPRYKKIQRDKTLNIDEKRIQTLNLNIKQLEEKKLGREAIIQELRETHKDASGFSTYADPLIYSSEPAIQMFALAVKEKMIEANDATIDTAYNLKDAYRAFRDWKGVSEGNPAKLYEDIIEEITFYTRDSTGKIVPMTTMGFVQPIDVTKYDKARNDAFAKFKKEFNFPESPSDYDEYFSGANPMGNQYMKATADWYRENTEPIEGALEYILNLERGMDSLYKQLVEASRAGDNNKVLGLSIELNGLKYEYNKVNRNGTPIGKLTTPKLSLYKNNKFDNMPPQAREYYNLLLETYKADQKKLGRNSLRTNSWDKFSYLLPSVRTDTIDSMKELGIVDPSKKLLEDTFTYQETDTEFGEAIRANGEPLKVIPRYFTRPLESKLISKNVTSSILMFNGMANRYSAKSDIVGVVNIMQAAVGERKITQMTSNGGPLLTRVASKFGYDLVPPVKGRETNTYKQLMGFIDAYYYGEEQKSQIVTIFGREMELNKTASFLSTGVAASTLSFNALQAINQLIIDSLSARQEAIASQFYSNQDLNWAKSKLHFSGQSLAAIKDGLNPKMVLQSKIGKMLELFDGMQDLGDNLQDTTTTTGRKLTSTKTLFILQRGVEFVTTAEKMLALSRTYKGKLKDSKGEVIKNEKGEDADIWDMLIETPNGKLDINPKVANFNKAQFIMKFHGIIKRTNQLKGKSDKVLLEREWWGKLLTLFRRYFVPGLRKRYGHNEGGLHIDLELGQVTEGYYGTMWDIVQDMLYFIRKGEYSNAFKALISAEGDVQKQQNMKRFAVEAGLVVLTMATTALAAALLESADDDEEEKLLNHIAYQSLRLKTELTGFANPIEVFRMIENPTAAANLVRNTWGLGQATFNLVGNKVGLVSDESVYYQKRSGNWEKGDLKWTKEFLDLAPIFSGIVKSQTPEEALKYYMLSK